MNAFEYIDEMKNTIEAQRAEASASGVTAVSINTFYDSMINMLNVLSQEMEQAEYNYQISSIDGKVETLESHTLLRKHLSDDVLIFQPIAVGEAELSAIDMQSLANVLREMNESGLIKENIVILPPNINIFKAILAKDTEQE